MKMFEFGKCFVAGASVPKDSMAPPSKNWYRLIGSDIFQKAEIMDRKLRVEVSWLCRGC